MSNAGTKFVLSQRFIFDPNSNSLTDQGNENEVIRLGNNESRILMMFSERPNEVISRDQLHEFVWRDQGFQVDDSSLTQAISTLRKNLKDSTKAPQFIKTVPKRGYQLISTVEKASIIAAANDDISSADNGNEQAPEAPETVTNKILTTSATDELTQPEIPVQVTSPEPNSANKLSIRTIYIFILAALLPVLVLIAFKPVPSGFKQIDTIDGVPLMTIENHPPMDEWKPVIRSCYRTYVEKYPEKDKPVEIIATAGSQRNLLLNYIHPVEQSYKNITIHLFANKEELTRLCN